MAKDRSKDKKGNIIEKKENDKEKKHKKENTI